MGSKRGNSPWEYQQNRAKKPWMRTTDSLVAVNPERITTLFDLAVEHYGSKCALCEKRKGQVVHHRHYRTIGFERPEEDIVLMCNKCHKALHKRSKRRQLTLADIPFVDPRWADSIRKAEERRQEVERLNRLRPAWVHTVGPWPLWLIEYRDVDGSRWAEVLEYPYYGIALLESKCGARIFGTLELVSVTRHTGEALRRCNPMYLGSTVKAINPELNDIEGHPGYPRG